MKPQVSIITPLHNKGAYIAETIESVLAQTMPDWEMIVVENYSTDAGPAIVRDYAAKDARVRLMEAPPEVRGPGAARNCGLAEATGEWVLFFDADDLLEPDHLQVLLAEAAAHPEAAVVAGYWQEFTDQQPAKRLVRSPSCFGGQTSCLQGAAIAFAPWAVHAALVRRDVLKGLYVWPDNLDLLLGEDVHFWFKLVSEYPVAYSTGRGALYRTETLNRRNQTRCIAKWYVGLDAAVQCNVGYLSSHGRRPSAEQCENLVRLYSELYWQAKRAKRPAIADEAIERADSWFDQRRALPKPLSLTDRWRARLGLRIYIALRSMSLAACGKK